jgi:hypothetical protein
VTVAAIAVGAAEVLVSGYEELRRVAVDRGDGAGRGVGLALFIRNGMSAWIEACAPSVQPLQSLPSPRQQVARAHVPSELRAEVAMVLAEMALSAHTAPGVAE